MIGYTLICSKRRTLALQVLRTGEVVVRAPIGTPREKIEKFVRERAGWLSRAIEKQRERTVFSDDPAVKKELMEKAKAILPGKLARYSAILGLYPSKISFRFSKSRFGSCSSKGCVTFSAYLMLYPDEAIDYVVAHELCHLRYMDHQKGFYALLGSVLPDYKERRKLLK